MKTNKHLATAFVLFGAATLISPVAMAEDTGWYVGGSVGSARAKSDTSAAQWDAALGTLGITSQSTLDESDTGYKLFAGYQINKNLAVEGGYVDLGEFIKYDSTVTAPSAGTVKTTLKNDGWTLDVVGILPLDGSFSVFGKVGAYISKTKLEVTATGGGGAATDSASKTDTNAKFGLGANYAFTKNVGVRVEWENYSNLGDENNTGEGDVNLFSVGITYKF